jgi:hypothetical protein
MYRGLLLLFFLFSALTMDAQSDVDALIHQPFGYACNQQVVESKLRGRVKERIPIENTHAAGVVDTIIKFKKGKNELAIYDGKFNTFCYGLQLHNRKWKLEADLQVGMSKKDFLTTYPQAKAQADGSYKLYDSDRVDWAIIEFNRREKVSAVYLGFYID